MKRVGNAWRLAIFERSPGWARRLFGPTARHIDMLVFDHGLFRLLYLNKHKLDRQVWRLAQPSPGQIARLARKGVRTLVNLRGTNTTSSYVLEKEACARHGIRLIDFQVRSRGAPSVEEVRGAKALFASIDGPFAMHCKSGADRAGLMSVLFRHFVQGVPIAQAKEELSLRYGHIRQADTGILDAFFERYLADTAQNQMEFMTWVETVYDPAELQRTFRASSLANRIVDGILRRE